MTDQQLIERFVTRREERAFRELYAAHTPAVYGLIRRLVGPRADVADDVLQDAWLRAAVALPLFRGDATFRTWLTGIALNCYRERRRRQFTPVDPSLDEPTTPDAAAAVDVLDVLDGLAPDHREVLVLHDVE